MVQKKQPAHRVKKNPNANSQEKLNCFGSSAAPAPQSASATNATTPRITDNPAKRPLSKYSPSGVGALCNRSLISLAPPVWRAVYSHPVLLRRVLFPADFFSSNFSNLRDDSAGQLHLPPPYHPYTCASRRISPDN